MGDFLKKESYQKVVRTNETYSVDESTGEILSHEKTTESQSFEKEPSYIKIYVDDIARLKEVPKGMTRILLTLVKAMSYGNIIPTYKPIKEHICNDLGISINYLNKAIDTFYKKGIILRVARGMYMADPELFGRGKWKDIKDLRLLIEYTPDGRKKLTSSLSDRFQLQLSDARQSAIEWEKSKAIKK